MEVLPFVHEGLGNSSYLVDIGNGRAAAIDPNRRVDAYLRGLSDRGLTLAAIFETHLHADFISGARELAAETGAPFFASAAGGIKYAHNGLQGGQSVQLDGCQITAIASPGHTPEHLAYVLRTAASEPLLFSGGSLIVGGAARSDLIAPDQTEALTRAQYRTLRTAFSHLPDDTVLLPTHGGGSFCSTGAGSDRVSTLGRERRENPALSIEDEEEFVRWFPLTFPGAPDFFFKLRPINQAGPRLRRDVPRPRPLSPAEFDAARRGALVVDARQKEDYSPRHIPASLSVPFRDSFGVWLGWTVDIETPLLFVLDGAPLDAVVDESLLVGFERFAGYLEGGIEAWERAGLPLAAEGLIDAREARRRLSDGALALDVREPSEWEAGRIPGAKHVPLGRLKQEVQRLPAGRPVVVYCGHGERASTAVSMLEAAGLEDLANLDGGIEAWRAAGFALEP
ncbi:MAG TPA: MBL fold metallo-hydrolase [Dehalococcoidia bacterium]|nr:MBL fold metallo-hydrolase [Dehalococcoidia bacterium]